MIHILFLVLKVIGLILLAILGILMLFSCIVLFIPVKYQIKAKTDDGIKGLSFEAKAHWLLHLLTAYYVYKEKDSDWQVRIGWKKLNHKDHEDALEEDVTEEEKNDESSSEQEEQPEGEREEKQCTIVKVCDKIKSIWETKGKVTDFLTKDIHVEAFKILKKEIGILAGHLSPRRIKGFIKYGFEDPYQTGKVLAGLSILYPFYGENIDITPDFEQKILEGDLYIKGHIRAIHFMTMLWRLFFNRYIRRTYKDFKILKSK